MKGGLGLGCWATRQLGSSSVVKNEARFDTKFAFRIEKTSPIAFQRPDTFLVAMTKLPREIMPSDSRESYILTTLRGRGRRKVPPSGTSGQLLSVIALNSVVIGNNFDRCKEEQARKEAIRAAKKAARISASKKKVQRVKPKDHQRAKETQIAPQSKWTPDMVKALAQGVHTYGPKWSVIHGKVLKLRGFTAGAIRQKWKSLQIRGGLEHVSVMSSDGSSEQQQQQQQRSQQAPLRPQSAELFSSPPPPFSLMLKYHHYPLEEEDDELGQQHRMLFPSARQQNYAHPGQNGSQSSPSSSHQLAPPPPPPLSAFPYKQYYHQQQHNHRLQPQRNRYDTNSCWEEETDTNGADVNGVAASSKNKIRQQLPLGANAPLSNSRPPKKARKKSYPFKGTLTTKKPSSSSSSSSLKGIRHPLGVEILKSVRAWGRRCKKKSFLMGVTDGFSLEAEIGSRMPKRRRKRRGTSTTVAMDRDDDRDYDYDDDDTSSRNQLPRHNRSTPFSSSVFQFSSRGLAEISSLKRTASSSYSSSPSPSPPLPSSSSAAALATGSSSSSRYDLKDHPFMPNGGFYSAATSSTATSTNIGRLPSSSSASLLAPFTASSVGSSTCSTPSLHTSSRRHQQRQQTTASSPQGRRQRIRALTVRQPWASAIIFGPKRIENRKITSKTPHIEPQENNPHGPHFHALLRPYHYISSNRAEAYKMLLTLWPNMPDKSTLPRSKILGLARIRGTQKYEDDKEGWALEGWKGWVIDKVIQLPPRSQIPAKGLLGLWRVDPSASLVLETILRTLLSRSPSPWFLSGRDAVLASDAPIAPEHPAPRFTKPKQQQQQQQKGKKQSMARPITAAAAARRRGGGGGKPMVKAVLWRNKKQQQQQPFHSDSGATAEDPQQSIIPSQQYLAPPSATAPAASKMNPEQVAREIFRYMSGEASTNPLASVQELPPSLMPTRTPPSTSYYHPNNQISHRALSDGSADSSGGVTMYYQHHQQHHPFNQTSATMKRGGHIHNSTCSNTLQIGDSTLPVD
eukprot:jgi/Bigna1/68462/fgenesh1_pg.6_\